mgnify:CR=1 FL=1
MIDWLLSVLRRIREYFTQIGDVTLAGEGLQYLRLVPAPTTILTERDRYRAIPSMTRDLGFHSLIRQEPVASYDRPGVLRDYSKPPDPNRTVNRMKCTSWEF